MFLHAELRVMWALLYILLICNLLIALQILLSVNSKKYVEDMLNTNCLFALTENQQAGSRLIKVENCDNKN